MIRYVMVALTMVSAALSWAAEAPDQLPGIYKVQGENYDGTVEIRKKGQSYTLAWTLGNAMHHGVGIRRGDVLASSWPGGVVLYEIRENRSLVGQYPERDGSLHRETLTFLRALPLLPPPREWKVGGALLVNWSKDVYWYPAKVTKKEGERYFVVFDTGNEEWTTADHMTADDLREGDRVFGNWQNRGTYYNGRITKRMGRDIHIKYDDGDEEDTTIGVVRVIRPRTD